MQPQGNQILEIVALGTSLMLFIAIFLISFIIAHKKKQNDNFKEKKQMELNFQTELVKTQMEVQEETRQNLAADLHDNIGQLLSLTNVTLTSVDVENNSKAQQKIIAAQHLIERSINELRQLSKLLHGEQLIQQGLPKAIEQEVNWLQKGGYYTVTYTNKTDESIVVNKDKALFLYRLLQESINNIVKHAEATAINIILEVVSDTLCLTVIDNGKGFSVLDTDITQHGLGLHNMQRRIALLNGNLTVTSEIGAGTKVCFAVPYP